MLQGRKSSHCPECSLMTSFPIGWDYVGKMDMKATDLLPLQDRLQHQQKRMQLLDIKTIFPLQEDVHSSACLMWKGKYLVILVHAHMFLIILKIRALFYFSRTFLYERFLNFPQRRWCSICGWWPYGLEHCCPGSAEACSDG